MRRNRFAKAVTTAAVAAGIAALAAACGSQAPAAAPAESPALQKPAASHAVKADGAATFIYLSGTDAVSQWAGEGDPATTTYLDQTNRGFANVSPDGTRMTAYHNGMWIIDLAGDTGGERVVPGAAANVCHDFVWTPDGDQILYPTSAEANTLALYDVEAKTSTVLPYEAAGCHVRIVEVGGKEQGVVLTGDMEKIVRFDLATGATIEEVSAKVDGRLITDLASVVVTPAGGLQLGVATVADEPGVGVGDAARAERITDVYALAGGSLTRMDIEATAYIQIDADKALARVHNGDIIELVTYDLNTGTVYSTDMEHPALRGQDLAGVR